MGKAAAFFYGRSNGFFMVKNSDPWQSADFYLKSIDEEKNYLFLCVENALKLYSISLKITKQFFSENMIFVEFFF